MKACRAGIIACQTRDEHALIRRAVVRSFAMRIAELEVPFSSNFSGAFDCGSEVFFEAVPSSSRERGILG